MQMPLRREAALSAMDVGSEAMGDCRTRVAVQNSACLSGNLHSLGGSLVRRHHLALALILFAPAVVPAQQTAPEIVARARAIHERVLTLDTHDDISPANFTAERNYTQRLTNQVNLPKMVEGGLDVSFMIVYVGQSNPPQVADAFQPCDQMIARRAARTPSRD